MTRAAKPKTGPEAAEFYGFELEKVPETCCLMCRQPIGDRSWEVEPVLARFGQMLFVHTDCDKSPAILPD